MREAQIIEQQRERIEFLEEQNRQLLQRINLLVRRIFGGGKSEKLSPGQLELLLGDETSEEPEASVEEPATAEAPTLKRKSAPRWPRYPEDLPVEEEIIDPEPVKANPTLYRQIGQEVSEQLDYEPGRFLRRRQVRRTFVKRNDPDAVPMTAPLPPKLLERSIMAPVRR